MYGYCNVLHTHTHTTTTCLILGFAGGLGDLDLLGDLSGLQLSGPPAAPIGGQPLGGGGGLFAPPTVGGLGGLGGLGGGLDLFGGLSSGGSGFYTAPTTDEYI